MGKKRMRKIRGDTKGMTIVYVIVMILVFVVGSLIVYGFTSKSIVDFSIEQEEEISLIPENRVGSIFIKTRNRGGIDAPAEIRLIGENVSFITQNKPYLRTEGNDIFMSVLLIKNGTEYGKLEFHFRIEEETESFSIEARVEKRIKSLSDIMSYIFGDVNPLYPTIVKYVKTDTYTYSLVE